MILVHSSSSMMCLRTWSKNVSKWQVQVGKRLRLELFWGFEAKRRCQSHKLGLHMQRDNPVTHSTCRCLRAQGIPWERKQTLLHWVLHCYKEITAKAFSFETPISNVMFYRKKSDFFFFSSFIFHQGFLSVYVHSSRFLSLSCGLRLPPEILFFMKGSTSMERKVCPFCKEEK